MVSIWQTLEKPIFILAPMEEVTDTVFRQIVAYCAPPDLYFTEFANCDGLQSAGREQVIHRFKYTMKDRPIIAQIWGNNPENYYKTVKDIVALGFDGIDINMGCPERKVVKNGSCAALINNHTLAKELILAAKAGANGLPVSVKTRIGINEIRTEEWIPFLLNFDLAAITVHARTVKEMSDYPAHWDEFGTVVKLRNDSGKETLIIGNGDVKDRAQGIALVKQYGMDGVMIGRGIFENVFAFDKQGKRLSECSPEEKIALMIKHAELYEATWARSKNFAVLRRFFKIYASGFDGAHELRAQLMQTTSIVQVRELIASYVSHL